MELALETFAGIRGPAAFLAAKSGFYLPVASPSYVAYSTARDPFATIRVARRRIEALKGAEARLAHAFAKKGQADTIALLIERISAAADPEEFEALVHAALDETHSLKRVEPIQSNDPEKVALAAYEPNPAGLVGDIIINGAAPMWQNIAEYAREQYEGHDISTGDPRHVIVHELGELALEQSVGFDNANPLGTSYAAVENEFQQEDLGHIYDVLGDRATHTHGEFVAEMFAGMMLGRAEELQGDEVLMGLYRKYGGEDIQKYTP